MQSDTMVQKKKKKNLEISFASCLTAKSMISDMWEATKPWQWIKKKNNHDKRVFISIAALWDSLPTQHVCTARAKADKAFISWNWHRIILGQSEGHFTPQSKKKKKKKLTRPASRCLFRPSAVNLPWAPQCFFFFSEKLIVGVSAPCQL